MLLLGIKIMIKKLLLVMITFLVSSRIAGMGHPEAVQSLVELCSRSINNTLTQGNKLHVKPQWLATTNLPESVKVAIARALVRYNGSRIWSTWSKDRKQYRLADKAKLVAPLGAQLDNGESEEVKFSIAYVHNTSNTQDGSIVQCTTSDDTVAVTAVSSDNRFVALGHRDGTIRVLDAETKNLVTKFAVVYQNPDTLAISADGEFIALGSGNSTFVYDTKTGNHITQIEGHSDTLVTAIAISADKSLIVTGFSDGMVYVSNSKTGQPLAHFPKQIDSRTIFSVAISSDNNLVAAGNSSYVVYVWNSKSGELISKLLGASGPVNSLAISADKSLIAGGNTRDVVALWDMSECVPLGWCIPFFRAHSNNDIEVNRKLIASLTISPDNSFMVIKVKSGTILVMSLVDKITSLVEECSADRCEKCTNNVNGDDSVEKCNHHMSIEQIKMHIFNQKPVSINTARNTDKCIIS
jgi:WD40 repeat protein